jgi:hypothetical protein
VRKGENLRPFAQALEAGTTGRLGLYGAVNDCLGVMAAYRLDFSSFGLRARADYCSSSFKNASLTAYAQEASLSVDIERVWDTGMLSVFAGVGLGMNVLYQSFETSGSAPSRYSSSPMVVAMAGAQVPVWRQLYAGLDFRLVESLIRYQQSSFEESKLTTTTGGQLAIFTGLHL